MSRQPLQSTEGMRGCRNTCLSVAFHPFIPLPISPSFSFSLTPPLSLSHPWGTIGASVESKHPTGPPAEKQRSIWHPSGASSEDAAPQRPRTRSCFAVIRGRHGHTLTWVTTAVMATVPTHVYEACQT